MLIISKKVKIKKFQIEDFLDEYIKELIKTIHKIILSYINYEY